MSNYIPVRNGLHKRVLPKNPLTVEFTNTKGFKYITTLENGRARERVDFFGIPVAFDNARIRDVREMYGTSTYGETIFGEPMEGRTLSPIGITSEQIREAVEYVFRNRQGSYTDQGDLNRDFERALESDPVSMNEAIQRLVDNGLDTLRGESLFEDEDVPGARGSSYNLILTPIEEQPLSQLIVTSNPILDGDNWTYEVAYPLTPDQAFEALPDSVSTVEYLTPDEMLRRGIITDIEYLDIISRDDNI